MEFGTHVIAAEKALQELESRCTRPQTQQLQASRSTPSLPRQNYDDVEINQHLASSLLTACKTTAHQRSPMPQCTPDRVILRNVDIDLPAMKIYMDNVHPSASSYTKRHNK